MEQHHTDIIRRLDEIQAALVGNPIAKDGGLVKKVETLHEDVHELKRFKDRSKWTASVLIGFAGVCGWCADKIIDIFTKH
jgi:hypothetical protein